MKQIKLFSLIALIFIISGCGGSGPTYDGSPGADPDESLQAMFPNLDFSADAELPEDIPPALEVFMCASMVVLFENLDQEEVDTDNIINEIFDGMTASDIEAYGVENDLMGCLSDLN